MGRSRMKINWPKFWVTIFAALGAISIIIAFCLGIEWMYYNIGAGWAIATFSTVVGIPFLTITGLTTAREDD